MACQLWAWAILHWFPCWKNRGTKSLWQLFVGLAALYRFLKLVSSLASSFLGFLKKPLWFHVFLFVMIYWHSWYTQGQTPQRSSFHFYIKGFLKLATFLLTWKQSSTNPGWVYIFSIQTLGGQIVICGYKLWPSQWIKVVVLCFQ